jgi:hypothetical protein
MAHNTGGPKPPGGGPGNAPNHDPNNGSSGGSSNGKTAMMKHEDAGKPGSAAPPANKKPPQVAANKGAPKAQDKKEPNGKQDPKKDVKKEGEGAK